MNLNSYVQFHRLSCRNERETTTKIINIYNCIVITIISDTYGGVVLPNNIYRKSCKRV